MLVIIVIVGCGHIVALWTHVSTSTADEGQRALAYTTLEHLDNMRHHADRINSPRINLGIRFPGLGNKA